MLAKTREFWRDNVIFGSASLISGLFNYLYHVVLAHVLGPGHYGDLTTFLNVTAFLVLPGPVITLLYTRLGRRQGAQARRETVWLWGGALAIWLGLIGLSAPLARMLHVSPVLLSVFSLEVVPSLALAANMGILQRVRWYTWVGILTVLITAFRVIAAGVAAFIHFHPLFSVGLLEGIAAFVAYFASRRIAGRAPMVGEPSKADVISGTAVVGVIDVFLAISDGLLAKHSLPALAAGRFNGLATIGHTVQFVSGSFGTVMLTSIIADPEKRGRFLATTAGVYGAISVAAELLFVFSGRSVVMLVLGRHFLPVVPWLPYYGWGMIALGLINIAMLYSVALKRWEAVAIAGFGLIYWIYSLLRSHSVGAFVRATTNTMVTVLVVSALVMVGVELWTRGGRPFRGRVRT
ncbi:capsular biosynthesis protein [Sulfobacillus sp. DSM 109850]|uniref:Capsular biosynthesis protein n=1 Tax=Sulfobacillus harzensis TaxID=2729629 RepID=A0A7Y0Q459_9FIRM|nr:capsular biosynthesis protein [Sulfobacillus harzensis]